MNNPFEVIDSRLSVIESLLLDLKHPRTPTMEEDSNLLTVQEAAKFLDLTVPTIYTKVSRGELPVIKAAKRIYFLKEDLISQLKKGKRLTANELTENAPEALKRKKGLNDGK